MIFFQKIFIAITLLILTLICFNCGQAREDRINSDSPLDEMGNDILGKKIDLSSVLKGDSSFFKRSDKQTLVYLYTGLDCSTCVMKGFDVLKDIQIKRSFNTIPISVGGNSGIIQLQNEFKEYIYQDSDDLIRKTLKYVYTPVILRVDKHSYVKEVLFVTNNSSTPSTIIKKLTK